MNTVVYKVAAVVSVCCLVLLTDTSVTAQVPGLVAHYKFDDAGSPGLDSSGNDFNGEVFDLDGDVLVVNDPERGSVLELTGSTGGFIGAEIPEVSGDGFTIAFWANRSPELCCGGGGANDGFFQVQDGSFDIPSGSAKIVGAWVQKSDAAVWGRIRDPDNNSLDNVSYFMEDEVWTHFAYRGDGDIFEVVIDGESGVGPSLSYDAGAVELNDTIIIGRQGTETWGGWLDDFRLYDRALSDEEIAQVMAGDVGGDPMLQAGDADMDLDFDQLDLVKVQVAAKYLSAAGATWGEGDWDGAPGGSQGNPPAGDGSFNQLDIIAALSAGFYLKGPYAAVTPGGATGDGQTSVGYNPATGEVFVDAPAGTDLTSINIDSAGAIFTGDAAQNLGGSFDNDADNNIFKATFGSSFGSITFGNVAQPGLSQDVVLNDLTIVGSLNGGGDLGNVDLIYVPEPAGALLLVLGVLGILPRRRRR